MTRAECERKLIELAEQADRIYREFNPGGNGIMICTFRDGCISVSDAEVDSATHEFVNWTIEAAKHQDGIIRSWDSEKMTARSKEDVA